MGFGNNGFLPVLKEFRGVRKMDQWTIIRQPGKCLNSHWHREHVFMLYLAWSRKRAFLMEGMPSRARESGVFQELQIVHNFIQYIASVKIINIILAKKVFVIMFLIENVASLLKIFSWIFKIKRIKFKFPNIAIKTF